MMMPVIYMLQIFQQRQFTTSILQLRPIQLLQADWCSLRMELYSIRQIAAECLLTGEVMPLLKQSIWQLT